MRFSLMLLLVLALLVKPASVQAQGRLSGVALDSVTHQPLPFASVFLANTTLGVTTTEQGQFNFPSVPAGNYDVVGSYIGYRLAKQSVIMSVAAQPPSRCSWPLRPTASAKWWCAPTQTAPATTRNLQSCF